MLSNLILMKGDFGYMLIRQQSNYTEKNRFTSLKPVWNIHFKRLFLIFEPIKKYNILSM